MGGSSWDTDVHHAQAQQRAATNTPTFKHDADVRSGKAAARVHTLLDITGKVRESRDSPAHPTSKAIAVMFDHTGSMGAVPRVLQQKLPQLMAMLLSRGYCEHPQVLFGAIGDCFDGSKAPLQVGQFESGNEMDDAFAAMLIEEAGGGTKRESYDLAMWYFANRVEMDCLIKRGEKGYLFVIGDEQPYLKTTRDQIAEHTGVHLEADLTIEQIAADLQKKFEVFFLIPAGTSYYNDKEVHDAWARLIGPERVVKLADPTSVCEAIASTVGLMEGAIDAAGLHRDLAAIAPASVVASVSTGLRGVADQAALARVGSGDLPARTGTSAVERL